MQKITAPEHTVNYLREKVRGEVFANGRGLVRAAFQIAHQNLGRRVSGRQAELVRAAAVALWHQGTLCAQGRAF